MNATDSAASPREPKKDHPSNPDDVIQGVLPLLGTNACVLHPRASDAPELGGGDFDCAVTGLDPQWVLRTVGVRVVQCIRHGPTGWYWVVETRDQVLAIDALDDPLGIGPYCFPSHLAFGISNESLLAVRAAFVTVKRLRKGTRESKDWLAISRMTAGDPERYFDCLRVSLGEKLARQVSAAVIGGHPPDTLAFDRAALALRFRRIRSPEHALRLFLSSVSRLTERLMHPTGLFIVIAGPDGTGKSTLAAAISRDLEGFFWRHRHVHWRPGVLPRPGALVGSTGSPSDEPHGAPPHSVGGSLAVLVYQWFDFLIGSWTTLMSLRLRSGLVVMERGWWDILVDPLRYRMRVPGRLVVALGRLLPKPDITFILETPAATSLARKGEISESEFERQAIRWRSIAAMRQDHEIVDATLPMAEVRRTVHEHIVSRLEQRTAARAGPGWLGFPSRRSPRWSIPRGPRKTARASFAVYQPSTPKSRLAWHTARLAASTGLLRVLPRGQAPARSILRVLAPHMPPRSTVAVLKGNHQGRHIALIIDQSGIAHGVAKVATDDEGREALQREAALLGTLGPILSLPLSAPKIIHEEQGLLLMEAIKWRPRSRPWNLDLEVARSLGRFYAAGSGPHTGFAHGDFAPWNLLQSDSGWTAVDWEAARDDAPPFYDLFHYLVQSSVLLGTPRADTILEALRETSGSIGLVIQAYADGAQLAHYDITDEFLSYLRLSRHQLDPTTPQGKNGLRARESLERRAQL